MSLIDDACEAYEAQLRLTWRDDLSGPERVWMLTYRPEHERRLRQRLGKFETATLTAGRAWHLIDISGAFEDWLSGHEYRDEYLADPESLGYGALDEFADHLADRVRAELRGAPPGSVAALLGAASLFGLTRLSRLIVSVSPEIQGRLLVFFPGTRDENNYRLLDGHDGFDYLAVPIN